MLKPTYVIDTNVIVDYVDIIPNGEEYVMDEPTVDLSNAHIIIPTAVIRELSSFKKEISTDRGKAARTALKRIRNMVEGINSTMLDVYMASEHVSIQRGNQIFSILPVHKNFDHCLPFSPSASDMDGQIILASLTTIAIDCGFPIDGTMSREQLKQLFCDNLTLLTNDNGLAIRAFARGINAQRFGYKMPPPYTGRRDLIVPKELFEKFQDEKYLSLEYWEHTMPNEPPLVANEFLIMTPENEEYPSYFDMRDGLFTHIGRFDVREQKIVRLQYVRDFPSRITNAGQAIYAEALLDPEIATIIATGPAGSGKTFMPTIYSYEACKAGEYIGVVVVPCYTDKLGLGALPGDLDEKLDPDVKPIKTALRNYLIQTDKDIRKKLKNLQRFGEDLDETEDVEAKTKKGKGKNKPRPERDADLQSQKSIKNRLNEQVDRIYDNWFENIHISTARGNDFTLQFVIYDEFQDQNRSQADTLIKRLGDNGKIVITGDIEQIHAAYLDHANNGLTYVRQLLKDDYQVAQVAFTEEEVVRHRLVRVIAERQKARQNQRPNATTA